MPRLRAVGLEPAATVFTPSRKMACASTVAVVVPSPATSEVFEATSRTIWAPMFSRGSRSSISLATVTPSLVMIGAPNFFSITALRPFGPRVIFTASARAFTPRRIDWREASPVTICFAILVFPPEISVLRTAVVRALCASFSLLITPTKIRRFAGVAPATSMTLNAALSFAQALLLLLAGGLRGAELRQDFFLAQDQQVFVVNLDFGAAILAKQNPVSNFHVEGNEFALFALAGTDGDYFAFLLLFLGGVGNDDAALDAFFFFNSLHDYPVVQRGEIHCHLEKPSSKVSCVSTFVRLYATSVS